MTHPGSIHRDIRSTTPTNYPPRPRQWEKQCNSRFIVSRAGYELRKLGGVHRLLYRIYAIPREILFARRCNDTVVAQPARKNGQELVPSSSLSCIAKTTSLRMIYERSNADRFVKSMGSRIFFKLPRVLSSSKCLESSRREIWSAFRLLLESFVR